MREAARRASVDPRTIRRWADTGQVQGRRTPGGHRQISLSGLEAAYSSASRRPGHTYVDQDPADAIPDWTSSASVWMHWRPPRRLSDHDLAPLRLDIAICRRALDAVEDAITLELHHRDEETPDEKDRIAEWDSDSPSSPSGYPTSKLGGDES